MSASFPSDGQGAPLTEAWRQEAVLRLFQGIDIASLNNGTSLRDCWVPDEALDASTGEILPSKNTYQQVRILGRSYPAHTAVLMLIHNRHAKRGYGNDVDEVGMHLCNNPACRNGLHLKFGTRKEDSEYKVRCGRAPSGESNGHKTKPERTHREDNHYNTRLKGEDRKEALRLIKKYCHVRGYAAAIAEYLGTTEHTIYNLKREGLHLDDAVEISAIELDIAAWTKKKDRPCQPKNDAPTRRLIAGQIRRRFLEATVHERSGLLLQFEQEFSYTGAWIRKILKRDIFPEVEPEIPVPTEWGVGRRSSFKHRPKGGQENEPFAD